MNGSRLAVIGLLSITLISLELIWTRIFSAEFFYTFAFLTLSLAIMGLGLGALALRLFRFTNRESFVGIALVLTALTALAGPPIVFKLDLKFSELFNNWAMVGKFLAAVAILSSSYFFGGMALASLFKQKSKEIPTLYMADLLGAGLGVVGAIVCMNWFGTQVATFLCPLPVLFAALIVGRSWLKVVPVALMAVMILLCTKADTLLKVDREEMAPVIYTHWDAMSKVKVFDFGGGFRGINIDNIANSPVYPFDGNWDVPDSMKFGFGIDVGNLITQFDSCTFLSLGAGGGTDVFQALQYGATEVHAVEINGHINEMMTEGFLRDFTGNVYNDPRVTVATEDARAYVRRFPGKFDVIYSLSSNSWAALASGAFALAENYIFTTEAFEDYWQALSDSGYMTMEHQFYMPRLVSEVMDALERQGVDDPTAHFAVYNLPQMRRNLILLSKRPLTDEIRATALGERSPEEREWYYLLYPAPDSLADNTINKIVQDGWETVAADVPIDISPATDNRPFVAQMGLWKNFTWEPVERILPYEFYGFPLAKVMIVAIIAIIAIVIIPLNLLPYFKKGEKLKLAPWLYFFAIGMAFMIVEIVLIQKYTLFIGAPIYSIVTVLLTLLVASGIGSRFADKIATGKAFGAILLWLLLDILLFGSITTGLGASAMALRIIITAILIFPLGFFMGMPFPKAGLRVGELIDWGFAVNGAASVLGATIVMLVAFEWGFSAALALGAILYLAAFGLISMKRAW